MTPHQPSRRTDNLINLRELLSESEDEEGLVGFVYSSLRIGDIWWIPDSITNFGKGERHPWIIVGQFSPRRPNVFAVPRTTKNINKKKGIITPAGEPLGLDRQGLILVEDRFRRPFLAKDFRDFEYLGRLPEDIIKIIKRYYRTGKLP